MSIEQGLKEHLAAATAVTDIVSTRIYPNVRPQESALPALVYTRLPGTRETQMSGPAPMVKVRIQVDCWHNSYAGVKTLADAVRTALNGVGIASPNLLGTQSVQLVELESDQDIPEIEGDKSDYRVSQDWIITYLEV